MEEDPHAPQPEIDANYEERVDTVKWNNKMDAKFGFEAITSTQERVGWLVNMAPAEAVDEQTKVIMAAVDFYFLEESGRRFKITYPHRPYFYVAIADDFDLVASSHLTRKYPFIHVDHVEKEDLDLKNHLSGLRAKYMKLTFPSMAEHMKVKKDLMSLVRKNSERRRQGEEFTTLLAKQLGGVTDETANDDVLTKFMDIREYDVPLDCRVAIDDMIFIGKWYTVCGCGKDRRPTIVDHPRGALDPVDPVVLAFDIECTKLPLKFPDAAFDEIMMISYMIDGAGYLIINRSIVSTDIEDFDYTPRDDVKGHFTIYNEADETALLKKFFSHILSVQPQVIVTYNGDFFDWMFVEARALARGISMKEEIGFEKNSQDEYKSRNCIHMDAFKWVKRDSYLPVGSQNLKAVAKAKLRYDPMEVDPEEMCSMARENPQALANYSVSDAVATYYLYMKYVHPFIFALCTIIPLGGDDVLRKGSGTLCEALLMVEAFHNNIIFPNKFTGKDEENWTKDGHKVENETYVGGHVEALEAGVFRADLPTRFRLVPACIADLRDEAGNTLEKELIREYGIDRSHVTNWDTAVGEVVNQLNALLQHPARLERPRIYHLDVGAMYPNIILTNRLQPSALVDDSVCMACCYNTSNAKCKRTMKWEWRGELVPCSRGEYERVLRQIEGESFGRPPVPFHQMKKEDRIKLEKKRVQDYSRRVYGKQQITRTETRESTICQRENAFYVDTVKNFRDRRYEYKEKLKQAKGELDKVDANDASALKTARGKCVLFESLQLAHKCILNSFYGYVMRKGSRWFSMEMAGIVCHTGANIITEARKLVEQIGRALELDTDGIWCLLPASFPENVTFELQNYSKKRVTISYPAAMLNSPVQGLFTNNQYHNLQPDGSYTISEENSIYFEVDGPYQAIILPASKEEGKKLKKRYAVFNLDGSLAELKGFEMKRRGELNVIKQFQGSVFKAFLRGGTLEGAYEAVAREANYWLDVLFSRGVDLNDHELFDLIGENRSMSKKLEEYGAQKSTSISTAKRLAEFLGDDVVKESGLACHFVISRYPVDAAVTERTIPLAIFQADVSVRVHYLKKWTRLQTITAENLNIRDLIDWSYYVERVGGCIQKIVTIPAALQGISNPVPRIPNPDWLDNKIRQKVNAAFQPKVTDHFTFMSKAEKRKKQEEDSETAKRRREEKETEEGEAHKENGHETQGEGDSLAVVSMAEKGVIPWLRSMQKLWRHQRKQARMARMRAEAAERAGLPVARTTNSLRSHFSLNSSSIWQVLSVEEEEGRAGVWWAWLVGGGGRMERVSMRVRRTLLVNQRVQRAATENCIRRALPRGHPTLFTYEHRVEEGRLQELMGRLQKEACTEAIEGIYESEVPPQLRVLSRLGCSTDVRISSGRVEFEEARRVPVPSYLGSEKTSSIFYYKYSQDSRCVVSAVCSCTGEAIAISVGGSALPNISSLYPSVYSAFLDKNPDQVPSDLKSSVSFSVSQCRNVDEADKVMEKWLRRRPSARVTLLCALGDDRAVRKLRELAIFPVVRLHVVEPRGLFNSIDSHRIMAKRMVQQFLYHFQYLEDYVQWARFLHIPIGNIPSDPVQFGLDLLMQRHLERAGHASWASPAARPDLGGKEMEDVRLAYDWSPLDSESSTKICKSALCTEYTVDMQMDALAVNAVVQKGRLMEAEGSDEVVHLEGGEGTNVEGSVRVLRAMLTELLQDIAANGSKRADELVIGLRRWLNSPSSFLFDPSIARCVSTLEKKLTLLLSAECTRLGATVVYASSSRLILGTGKKQRSEAEAFVSALRSSLSSNPLFSAVHMHQTRLFTALLFLDNSNFSGVYEEEEDDLEEVGDETVATRKVVKKVFLKWRIADDLEGMDGGIVEEFNKIINGYLLLTQKTSHEKKSESVESRCRLLRGDLLERLLRIVERLVKRGGDATKAAGALAHSVCTAISADSQMEDDVECVREQVARLVAVSSAGLHPIYMSDVVCECGHSISSVDVSSPSSWSCPDCSRRLSPSHLDHRLSISLQETLALFLAQDQKCLKCSRIAYDNLAVLCDCSGGLDNTVEAETLKTMLTRTEAAAKVSGLAMAEETSRWISQTLFHP